MIFLQRILPAAEVTDQRSKGTKIKFGKPVTTDKDSRITNDANLWATETMGNAKCPLELFLRAVTVSMETMKIVNEVPEVKIGELK